MKSQFRHSVKNHACFSVPYRLTCKTVGLTTRKTNRASYPSIRVVKRECAPQMSIFPPGPPTASPRVPPSPGAALRKYTSFCGVQCLAVAEVTGLRLTCGEDFRNLLLSSLSAGSDPAEYNIEGDYQSSDFPVTFAMNCYFFKQRRKIFQPALFIM